MFNDLMDQAILGYLHQGGRKDKSPRVPGPSLAQTQTKLRGVIVGPPVPAPPRLPRSSRDISYDHLDKKSKISLATKKSEISARQQSESLIRREGSPRLDKDAIESFYQKNIFWRLERDTENQRVQKKLMDQELQECTFSPRITPFVSQPQSKFVSFSGAKGAEGAGPVHYSDMFVRREVLRRKSPLKGQKSYRKIDDKKNCVASAAAKRQDPGRPPNLEKKISQLKDYLHNMEF